MTDPWFTLDSEPIPESRERRRRSTAEIDAEIEAARPPHLALGQHAYPLDDFPGWTREEDRWHGRWVFRRVADGYTFTDSAPTSHDIEEGIACAPPIEAP